MDTVEVIVLKQACATFLSRLTQGIVELYQKYVEENEIDKENLQQNGLDKINQQAYIFANLARAMRKNKFP